MVFITMLKRSASLSLLALLLGASSGCSPVVRTHGNVVTSDNMSQIVQGVTRRDDVLALLGTPTAEGTFNSNEWYYISQRTEQTAFFKPDVTERKVVRITFDSASGTVANVETLGKEAGEQIKPVARTTPTAGHNVTALEQILGNVGRFTPKNNEDDRGP